MEPAGTATRMSWTDFLRSPTQPAIQLAVRRMHVASPFSLLVAIYVTTFVCDLWAGFRLRCLVRGSRGGDPRALYARAAEPAGWPHRDSLAMCGWWAMIYSMLTRRHRACTVAGATSSTLDTGPWHRRGLAACNIEQHAPHHMLLCDHNSCNMHALALP